MYIQSRAAYVKNGNNAEQCTYKLVLDTDVQLSV